MVFFKVYSLYYLVVFFEVFSLINILLLLPLLNNVILIFYLFLTFLVVEAALSFSLMVVFSRRRGSTQLLV